MRHVPVPLIVCVLLFANAGLAAGVDRASLSTLTNLVTISLSQHERFDVLASSDVREVVALEAEKQAIGCESDASCLAEVAGAMGARFVVFGQLGTLGSLYVLTLNLFDSEAASAAGRVVLKADSLEGLAEKLDAAVARLVAQGLQGAAGDEELKVLVLDLKPAAGVVTSAPEPPATASSATAPPDDGGSLPWFLVSGGAVAGLGVVGLAGGAGLGLVGAGLADEANELVFQDETIQKRDEANGYGVAANTSFLVGGALIIVGASVAALELVLGGEE